MKNYDNAKSLLKTYNQEHLLRFYNELNTEEKETLVNQICQIDFKQIFDLYEASKIDEVVPTNLIEPLPYVDKEKLSQSDLEFYTNIGKNSIKNGEYAVVTMAGGQGTRLGCKGPKGSFELDIFPKKSLFEITCDYLKIANDTYGVIIPWFIMTSAYNDKQTKEFFANKNFFNYPKDSIFFFVQEELPLIDISGNLILEETFKVKEVSNGNGDVFKSMKKNGIINNMKEKNIKWIFFTGVDNVLLEIVDPILLGITINNNYEIGSKTLLKKDANSKDWVFARKNGKPAIINSCHFTPAMKDAKDENDNYLYRDINMLAHLFSISAIELLSTKTLPYHRAFKKNNFVNEEGMKQIPDAPNTFKFENFIFDAFAFFDNISLLRVKEEDEFAPIKDFNGIHNPEVAKYMYEKKFSKMNTRDVP